MLAAHPAAAAGESSIFYIRLAERSTERTLHRALTRTVERASDIDFRVEREHPRFDRQRAAAQAGVSQDVMPDLARIYRIVFDRPVRADSMVALLEALPFVDWAESATGLERRAASNRRHDEVPVDVEPIDPTARLAPAGSSANRDPTGSDGSVVVGIFDSWHSGGSGPAAIPSGGTMPRLEVIADRREPDRYGASYAGHGLQVASVASATLRTLAEEGSGVRLQGYWCFLRNIPQMVDDGVRVISISALYSDRPRLREYVKYALASGVVVVAAAGNHYSLDDGVNYPAAYHFDDLGMQVIAVAATDDDDRAVPGFVTSPGFDPIRNPERAFIDVAAPGVDIRVLDARRGSRDGQYVFATGTATGTSLSVPAVSALAAELLAVNSDLTVRDVYELITYYSDRVDDLAYVQGWSPELGFGRINATRSLNAAQYLPVARILVAESGESMVRMKAAHEFGIPPFTYSWHVEKADGSWVRAGSHQTVVVSTKDARSLRVRVTDSKGRVGRAVVGLDGAAKK